MDRKISVLIVDDSALVRQILTDIISRDPELAVAGTARNGVEAIKLVKDLDPDVVTMDIYMPEMDGLTALEYIMKKMPRPVVMLSVLAKRGAAPTLKALELGAADFVAKPTQLPTAVAGVREEIVEKVKTAARSRAKESWERLRKAGPAKRVRLKRGEARGGRGVVIGASAGGPVALMEIITALPAELPAFVTIVQHMPGPFTKSFAERLDSHSRVEVKEASNGEHLREGLVLLVPGGRDLVFQRVDERLIRVALQKTVAKHGASPVIDVTMESAAEVFADKAIGVLLSGMGSDGALGLGMIKDAGGITIAQNEETSLVYGMPKAAIERKLVDDVLPIEEIARAIVSRV